MCSVAALLPRVACKGSVPLVGELRVEMVGIQAKGITFDLQRVPAMELVGLDQGFSPSQPS